jgi:hypothetical protein
MLTLYENFTMVLHRAAHFSLKEKIKPFNSKACILADFKRRDNVCHMAGARGEDITTGIAKVSQRIS